MTIRITHVISDLTTGGAETMLLRLLQRMDRTRFASEVISLKQLHPVGDAIAAAGIPVRALEMGKLPTPLKFWRLGRLLKHSRPDIVQTWLTHADLLGGVAARMVGVRSIVWGIHVGKIEKSVHGTSAVVAARLNAALSGAIPRRIVSCSDASLRQLVAFGVDEQKIEVIYNGFDLAEFAPDPAARARLRAECNIPADGLVVLHVGRFHLQKDYSTLLAAVKLVMRELPSVYYLLCGRDVNEQNPELVRLCQGTERYLQLLGERRDVRALMAAADIVCLSSQYGEAFPLVLGEAMAVGAPCVTTDCGDSGLIVGDAGRVVPIRDPEALAKGLVELLSLPGQERSALATQARDYVGQHFSIALTVKKYQALYERLAFSA